MSKVVNFENVRQRRDNARDVSAQYLARLDAGATADDIKAIEAWLAEHPVHREVFLEMAALWDNFGVLSSLSEMLPLEDYSTVGARQPRYSDWFSGKGLLAAACALLVVTLSGAGLLTRQPAGDNPDSADNPSAYQHYETSVGDQTSIMLPDGSEIILNTDSELEVAYSRTTRNIYLPRGEGFFDVEPDPARPFRVYAGNRLVEAVGTSFTVEHTRPENVAVLVKEGKVNFHRMTEVSDPLALPQDIAALLDPRGSIALQAGERASALHDMTSPVDRQQVTLEDMDIRLSWTTGMLQFQGDTLAEVVNELSRYTTTEILLVDSIRNIEVQGYYRPGDLAGFRVAMKENFDIDTMQLGENQILLYPQE